MFMRLGVTILVLVGAVRSANAARSVTAARGLAMRVPVEGATDPLQTKPDQTTSSALLVRVLSVEGEDTQSIEFIGLIPGRYDLRDFVERVDGRPAMGLPEMPVEIVSMLPEGKLVGFEQSELPAVTVGGRYTLLASILGGGWLLIPLVVLIRRRLLRRPHVVPSDADVLPEDLATQVRTLLLRAQSDALSVEERGQLELLVFRLLAPLDTSEENIHEGATAERIRRLRAHPQTRDLVLQLERWLHGKPASATAAAPDAELVRAIEALASTWSASHESVPQEAGAEGEGGLR